MLNPNTQERELVYVVLIDSIEPITGSDNCECAIIGGWHIMVRKGQFDVGDPAIYFEIDSKVPSTNPAFSFLEKRNYKVKTQKFTFGGKGNFISQGLLMHASDFGWEIKEQIHIDHRDGSEERIPYIVDDKGIEHYVDDESRFLTKLLGVTYADEEDNQRKAPSVDKYKKMAQRHPNIFKKPWARWLMKRSWGRKLMFMLFGKKKDKKNGWPSHIAAKTDVERIQNMIWLLKDKQPYVATEKVDGSSFSAMAERGKFNKIKYYVCSRNVVFETPDSPCFYDSNIYFEAWNKYNLKEIITNILNDYNLPNVAIQAEVYGDSVQKRNYSLSNGEHQMAVFHIVSNGVKFPMDKTVEICEKYGLPHVPIVDDNYIFPDTIEELQTYVEGENSRIDGKPREGIVFYDKATGQIYTKFVSPNFLMKYHS